MALTTVLPETFTRAVSALRQVRPREEIALEEVPPPTKLAPYSFALGASVLRRGEEVTTGRLILLHDPAGHEAWEGDTRLVCYVQAEVESDLANDPLLPQVTWGWLVDALDSHTDGYLAIGGGRGPTTPPPPPANTPPPPKSTLPPHSPPPRLSPYRGGGGATAGRHA
ncbi:MAG TPA: hypothetical protein DGT23_15785, partial [Micromonosporaceae bacterium]|nr:hypothetical protein [Micromonosporaceae bacterium]